MTWLALLLLALLPLPSHAVGASGSFSGDGKAPTLVVHSQGQSNMVGKSDEGLHSYSPAAGIQARVFDPEVDAWEVLDDPVHEVDGSTSSWWPRFAELVADQLGFETRLIAGAVGGTTVWEERVNFCEWDPGDTLNDSCSKRALNAITTSGVSRVDVGLWNQGESDNLQVPEKPDYEAALTSHFTDFNTEHPDTRIVVIPVQLKLHQPEWANTNGNVRESQLTVVGQQSYLYESLETWDYFEFASDNVHITDTETAAWRLFNSMLGVLPFEKVMPRAIYVDNGCTSCGSGTESAPYATLSAAVSAAIPGTTIYVQGGSAYSGTLDFDGSGISGEKGRPIVVVPTDSTTPIIKPHPNLCAVLSSYIYMFGIQCDMEGIDEGSTQSSTAIRINGDHNILSAVELRGNPSTNGIHVQDGADHNRLLGLDVDFTLCTNCSGTNSSMEAVAVNDLATDTYILGGTYNCTEHSCFQIDGDGTYVSRVTAMNKTAGEAIMLIRHTITHTGDTAPGNVPVVVEVNEFLQSSAGEDGALAIQVRGMPGGIIRRNLIHRTGGSEGVAIFNGAGGPNAGEIAGIRAYNNLFIGNPSWGLRYKREEPSPGDGCTTAALDLAVLNNLFYENDGDAAGEQIEIERECASDGNTGLDTATRIENNLIGDSTATAVIDIDADGGETVSSAETAYSQITGTLNQSFEACNPGGDDYRPGKDDLFLREGGVFLTTVASATSSGTSFDVADASFFFEGSEIIPGDTIKTAAGEYAKITDITGNTLTVHRSISFTNGEGVSIWWEDHSDKTGMTGGPAPGVGYELHGCKFSSTLTVSGGAAGSAFPYTFPATLE